MPAILLSNLSWSAPDGTAVLADLNFRFASERIGLIGRNGVGKSTLLGLIAGEIAPSRGSVAVDGSTALLRQSVAAQPDARLANLFDAGDALALIAQAEGGDLDALAQCDWTLPTRIGEALAQVGLDADPATPLDALSGGQRTRAALAAAFFARPDFLLLDEPTNHLDTQGRNALIALLARWRGGAIIVSHDRALLETVDAIAELTPQGIARHGGNWSAWRARKDVELAAAHHDLNHAEHSAATLARRTQTATERKQRRDGAGKRDGAKGGIPRILLGQRKAQAEQSGGDAIRRAARQREAAQAAVADARAKIDRLEPLHIICHPRRCHRAGSSCRWRE